MGAAAAVWGDYAVLGAPTINGWYKGSAYVFHRDRQEGWKKVDVLVPPIRRDGDEFGASVVMEGNTLVVGAPGTRGEQDTSAFDTGAVYFYRLEDGVWKPDVVSASMETGGKNNEGVVQPTFASDWVARARFGQSLAIQDGVVLVGAPKHAAQPTVYVFTRENGVWGERGKLRAKSGARSNFGASVALTKTKVFVGAPRGLNTRSAGTGVVHVWDRLIRCRRPHG